MRELLLRRLERLEQAYRMTHTPELVLVQIIRAAGGDEQARVEVRGIPADDPVWDVINSWLGIDSGSRPCVT